MAKDPAMLWYWNDWYSGTVLMSRFLKGCYIDLLHAQFNNGPLSLDEVKAVLSGDFGQSWPTLVKKFSVNPDGLYFNERLELEKNKRKAFTESRRNNRSKKTYDATYDKHMIEHMTNHMENRNENIISSLPVSVLAEKKFTIEHCLTIALNDKRWVEANGATRGYLEAFNKHLEKRAIYEQNPMEYKKYFPNWLAKNKPEAVVPDKKMVI